MSKSLFVVGMAPDRKHFKMVCTMCGAEQEIILKPEEDVDDPAVERELVELIFTQSQEHLAAANHQPRKELKN